MEQKIKKLMEKIENSKKALDNLNLEAVTGGSGYDNDLTEIYQLLQSCDYEMSRARQYLNVYYSQLEEARRQGRTDLIETINYNIANLNRTISKIRADKEYLLNMIEN